MNAQRLWVGLVHRQWILDSIPIIHAVSPQVCTAIRKIIKTALRPILEGVLVLNKLFLTQYHRAPRPKSTLHRSFHHADEGSSHSATPSNHPVNDSGPYAHQVQSKISLKRRLPMSTAPPPEPEVRPRKQSRQPPVPSSSNIARGSRESRTASHPLTSLRSILEFLSQSTVSSHYSEISGHDSSQSSRSN